MQQPVVRWPPSIIVSISFFGWDGMEAQEGKCPRRRRRRLGGGSRDSGAGIAGRSNGRGGRELPALERKRTDSFCVVVSCVFLRVRMFLDEMVAAIWCRVVSSGVLQVSVGVFGGVWWNDDGAQPRIAMVWRLSRCGLVSYSVYCDERIRILRDRWRGMTCTTPHQVRNETDMRLQYVCRCLPVDIFGKILFQWS
jgi:hypothetical protein